MKIYAIPGLGADERMFEKLELNVPVKVLSYIKENASESIESYARRMAKEIDTTEDFVLLGVSFGGFMVVEMNKFLNPSHNFLITTVANYKQLPFTIHLASFLRLYKFLPITLIKKTMRINNWFFGTESKEDEGILKYFIDNARTTYLKWGIRKIVHWRSMDVTENVTRIHGDDDRILPVKRNYGEHISIKGGHLIIVNRAKEISEIINNVLSQINP
jgi:hypothetical protein